MPKPAARHLDANLMDAFKVAGKALLSVVAICTAGAPGALVGYLLAKGIVSLHFSGATNDFQTVSRVAEFVGACSTVAVALRPLERVLNWAYGVKDPR